MSLAAPGRQMDQRRVVAVVYVATFFITALDTTIVNVTLSTLGRQFGGVGTETAWVVTGFLLGLAVCIPVSGWLADRVGARRVLLGAIGLFTLASAGCGLAPNLTVLIITRVLQGAAGGALTPIGMALLYRVFPPQERSRVASLLIIPTVLAPASGPLLGGLLVDTLGWRWVFFVNLPIGIAALTFGYLYLEEYRIPREGRFDPYGFVLAALGLSGVLLCLSNGPTHGWGNSMVVLSGIIGVTAFVALVIVERRLTYPMLRLGLLRDRLFRSCALTTVFAYAAFTGALFTVPQLLQDAHGSSAFMAGSSVFPEAIGVAGFSQVAARLYRRVGPRRLMVVGLVLVAVMLSCFIFVTPTTSLWWVRVLTLALGMSMANVFIPLQSATFARVEPSATAQASTIYSAQRFTSQALGVAVLATVFTTLAPHPTSTLASAVESARMSGFHAAMIAAAILALMGVGVALTVNDRDAAQTFHPVGD